MSQWYVYLSSQRTVNVWSEAKILVKFRGSDRVFVLSFSDLINLKFKANFKRGEPTRTGTKKDICFGPCVM